MTNRRIKPKLPGRVSRLISRFNRGDSSPLVVQTGFPTSLADLVVKNFSRLKKPKSAKKRSAPLPCSFRCTREEEIPEVVCQPEPEESVSFKPSNAVVRSQRLFDGPIGAIKASEGDDVALVNNQASQRKKNHMFGVQATLLLLSALFVCCKELVLGIMAFAVALLLLESFSSRLLFFQKHREDDIIEQSDGKQLIPEIAQESDNPRTEKIKKNRCWKNHIASELHGREIEEEDHPVTVTASRGVKSAETEEENRDDDGDDNEDKKGKNKDKNDNGENKKDQNNTIRSSNYLVLLIVVILWGLIGGRMLALGLTLISSYLVKISGMRIHM